MAGPKEVSMIHQLADGFFHSHEGEPGRPRHPCPGCVSTDQPSAFHSASLSDDASKELQVVAGRWWAAGGGKGELADFVGRALAAVQ